MLKIKVFAVILHVIGWVLFIMFPLLFVNGNQSVSVFSVLTTLPYIEFCLCYIVLFYLHGFYLVPQLFIKKKYLAYLCSIFLLLVVVNLIRPFDKLISQNKGNTGQSYLNPTKPPISDNEPLGYGNGPKPNEMRPPPRDFDSNKLPPTSPNIRQSAPPPQAVGFVDITSIFIFIIVLAFSMAIQLVKQWRETEQRALRAETDKANAELSFLKAQINPHFLYNTLNNIYTLSLMQSEHTSESIMKLSNIMRYIIDDATHEFVSLIDEINCISDYIDLQKLRIGNKVELDFKVAGIAENHKIAPLVLMTFVENLFKYGISKHQLTVLKIYINATENELNLYSQNPIFDRKEPLEGTGIGIKNTTQRLDFLYPKKYSLQISNQNRLFIVKLNVKLS